MLSGLRVEGYYFTHRLLMLLVLFSVRSPTFAHVSETLSGITNIRIFDKSGDFMDTFRSMQDKHTSCGYLYRTTQRVAYLYLSFGGTLFFISMVFSMVVLSEREYNIIVFPKIPSNEDKIKQIII